MSGEIAELKDCLSDRENETGLFRVRAVQDDRRSLSIPELFLGDCANLHVFEME